MIKIQNIDHKSSWYNLNDELRRNNLINKLKNVLFYWHFFIKFNYYLKSEKLKKKKKETKRETGRI